MLCKEHAIRHALKDMRHHQAVVCFNVFLAKPDVKLALSV